jgi:hypothetical protein
MNERLRTPQNPLKKAGLFVGGGITALAITACAGEGQSPQSPDAGSNIHAPTLTVEPTKIESPAITPTPEVTVQPTPTATPEAKPEVPCLILPQEFCKKAERIEYKTPDGTSLIMLGFKDLPAGTEIISPFDAEALGATLEDHPLKGNMVLVFKKGDHSEGVEIIGDIRFHGRISWEFPKGDVLATIEDNGITNIDNYNLLILMTKKNENGKFETNTKMLNDLFPGIVSQEPVAIFQQTSSGGAQLGDRYFPEHQSPPPGSQE